MSAAARMNSMIDALLSLSQLSTRPLACQPVNLSQQAEYVMDELKRAAPLRELVLNIEAGLVVQGEAVSRLHGRIEFEKEKFYYVDESRNGTYVLTHDGTEVKVLAERVLLVGDGVISPGMPVMKQTGQVIRFNCSPIRLDLGGGDITKPR